MIVFPHWEHDNHHLEINVILWGWRRQLNCLGLKGHTVIILFQASRIYSVGDTSDLGALTHLVQVRHNQLQWPSMTVERYQIDGITEKCLSLHQLLYLITESCSWLKSCLFDLLFQWSFKRGLQVKVTLSFILTSCIKLLSDTVEATYRIGYVLLNWISNTHALVQMRNRAEKPKRGDTNFFHEVE